MGYARRISLAVVSTMTGVSLLALGWSDHIAEGVSAGPRNRVSLPASHPERTEIVTLPIGTRINILLKEDLTLDRFVAGEEFAASLFGPLLRGSNLLAHSRSKIIGQVTNIPGAGGVTGGLAIELRTLVIDGKEYGLQTEPLALPDPVFGLRDLPEAKADQTPYKPTVGLTMTLSAPVALPVIRRMGVAADGF